MNPILMSVGRIGVELHKTWIAGIGKSMSGRRETKVGDLTKAYVSGG